MPSDLAATADAGFGLPLDAAAAHNIAFVGFDGDDEIRFIGFDDEALSAPLSAGAAALPHGLPPSLAERLWRLVRSRILDLFAQLRFQLIGTELHARRTRNALVILGAVVLSVGCGLVLRNWLPARQAASTLAARIAPVAPPLPPRAVLVADKAISRGQLLHPGDLRWQRWPADRIKEGYIEEGARALQQLVGYAALQPLAAGDPVLASAIVAPADRGFLAAALPPGMRAVSIDIREETAAAGLIMPGDEVDVLLALPVQERIGDQDETHRAVETVLSNVPVLAIDQQLDAPPQHAILGSTATLAVTPKQAEIITLADDMAQAAGNLRLTLHSLVRDDHAQAAAAAPGSLVESDISKLLPAHTPRSRPTGGLTIVRRGQASAASGS
ncbi:MAG: Flp pilus assembly protein CpaB [Thiohalocapsa sp.]